MAPVTLPSAPTAVLPSKCKTSTIHYRAPARELLDSSLAQNCARSLPTAQSSWSSPLSLILWRAVVSTLSRPSKAACHFNSVPILCLAHVKSKMEYEQNIIIISAYLRCGVMHACLKNEVVVNGGSSVCCPKDLVFA